MAAPNTSGICSPWAVAADAQDCPPCANLTDEQLAPWLTVASELLYRLSGRQFSGQCTTTVRPCARSDSFNVLSASYWWGTWNYNSAWGMCSCNRPRECGCTRLSEITLGGYPVIEIVEVLQDGAVVDPSFYRVDDYRYLVGVEGNDGTTWAAPCCQDLALDTTSDNTFSVEFIYGTAPPEAGKRAAAEWACQMALSCTGSSECRLPQRVQSITRQGVSMVMLDPMAFLEAGRTGLYLVDSFIAAYNGSGIKARAQVLSPNMRRRVRRAGVVDGS